MRNDFDSSTWTSIICASFVSGALLGPNLDGFHSSHNVLHYTSPQIVPFIGLETAWWVPVLFGVAAILLGPGHVLADRLLKRQEPEELWLWGSIRPAGGFSPPLPFVMAGKRRTAYKSARCFPAMLHLKLSHRSPEKSFCWCFWCLVPSVLLCCLGAGVVAFAAQYWCSGALEVPLAGVEVGGIRTLDLLLFSTAMLHWRVFDNTPQGFLWGLATAVGGPLIEIALIHAGLYSYTNPDWLGIPFWIPWVYFCGAPANANLGRFLAKRFGSGGGRE